MSGSGISVRNANGIDVTSVAEIFDVGIFQRATGKHSDEIQAVVLVVAIAAFESLFRDAVIWLQQFLVRDVRTRVKNSISFRRTLGAWPILISLFRRGKLSYVRRGYVRDRKVNVLRIVLTVLVSLSALGLEGLGVYFSQPIEQEVSIEPIRLGIRFEGPFRSNVPLNQICLDAITTSSNVEAHNMQICTFRRSTTNFTVTPDDRSELSDNDSLIIRMRIGEGRFVTALYDFERADMALTYLTSLDVNNRIVVYRPDKEDERTARTFVDGISSFVESVLPGARFLDVSEDLDEDITIRFSLPKNDTTDAVRNIIPQQFKELAEGSMVIDTSGGAILENLPEILADSNGTSIDDLVNLESPTRSRVMPFRAKAYRLNWRGFLIITAILLSLGFLVSRKVTWEEEILAAVSSHYANGCAFDA